MNGLLFSACYYYNNYYTNIVKTKMLMIIFTRRVQVRCIVNYTSIQNALGKSKLFSKVFFFLFPQLLMFSTIAARASFLSTFYYCLFIIFLSIHDDVPFDADSKFTLSKKLVDWSILLINSDALNNINRFTVKV